jgi:nucleoside-diphosphate-sugar epimerase
MKVLVAGAAGAVGSRLVPLLAETGHEVVAMTRSPGRSRRLLELGATPAIADGLDADAVLDVVRRHQPEVIVHQMTALAGVGSLRRFDHEFALTNRLRTEGTHNLLAAARDTGVRRVVAQSFGGWPYGYTGVGLKTEDDPLDPAQPRAQRRSFAAIAELERSVTSTGGIALRYGGFYGPGTALSADGEMTELVRRRRLPVVGSGAGVWSFVHIDDMAWATLLAIREGAAGAIYNVVDDEPAPVSDWLPELARAIGVPAPRHVPRWVGRLAAGEVAVSMMTRMRGMSNAKARRELGWEPRFPTYREGFARGLADPVRDPGPGRVPA